MEIGDIFRDGTASALPGPALHWKPGQDGVPYKFSEASSQSVIWNSLSRQRPEPNRRLKTSLFTRPCGQFLDDRRFTSAQIVPANAGAKAKNPAGSTLFSTPMVALLRHADHKILRTCLSRGQFVRDYAFSQTELRKSGPFGGSLKYAGVLLAYPP